MDITLCLIVKNEEEKLPACLKSFQGVFQKLLIVDTGSDDKTVQIAKDFNAEIHTFKWNDNFSDARNFALSKVKTTWTMVVDADDYIDENSKKELLEKIKKISKKAAGISLPYLYSTNKNDKGSTAYLPRIWRTDLQLRYTLPIHEYLDITAELRDKFMRLDVPIRHNKTSEDISKSLARNIKILEKSYKDGVESSRIIFYLGHDNFYAGNAKDSINWMNEYLKLEGQHPHEIYKVQLLLGKAWQKLGNLEMAKKSFHNAIQTNPDFIEPYILLGDIAQTRKNYEEAVQKYFEALYCEQPVTHIFINTYFNKNLAQQKLTESLFAIQNGS